VKQPAALRGVYQKPDLRPKVSLVGARTTVEEAKNMITGKIFLCVPMLSATAHQKMLKSSQKDRKRHRQTDKFRRTMTGLGDRLLV
jgi:hypothetical protein